MSAKHTPGPWAASFEDTHNADCAIRRYAKGESSAVEITAGCLCGSCVFGRAVVLKEPAFKDKRLPGCPECAPGSAAVAKARGGK